MQNSKEKDSDFLSFLFAKYFITYRRAYCKVKRCMLFTLKVLYELLCVVEAVIQLTLEKRSYRLRFSCNKVRLL